MTDHRQRDLVDAARAGKKDALHALLKEVQLPVYRFGMKMCGDPQDAEDVLQETLLAMARTIGDFRGASSITTWLYTIARSFCIKKRRQGKFAPTHLESLDTGDGLATEQLVAAGESPEKTVADRELLRALESALASLEPEYREVMILRDAEGLSAAEVAEVLGISVAATKSRLHRARAQVREQTALLRDAAPAAGVSRGSCPDIVELFSRHIEDELSANVCTQMEHHLASCSVCRGTCDSLKQMLAVCRDSGVARIPVSLEDSVHKAIGDFLAANR